jgi:pentatricopeptide repeat protein
MAAGASALPRDLLGSMAAGSNVLPRPDVVSFSTVIYGLSKSRNAFAADKALELYRQMRRLAVAPDAGVARSVLRSCASLRGGRAFSQRDARVDAARDVLADADAFLGPQAAADLRALAAALLSPNSAAGGAVRRKRSDDIFEQKEWNSFDSGFHFL